MYIFAAVSTFFIYQMLSKSYRDCINKFITDTFHLPEKEKIEIRKPEDNEIEDIFLVKKNDSFEITNKYNNIKEYLGDENVNVKKLDKEGDYVQINYWMNNEIYSVMYTNKIVFPVYTPEEIEKHPATEKKIKTSYLKLKENKEKQEDCKDIIMNYSGPKHNFYTDKENIKDTLIKDVFVEYPEDKYTDLVIIDQFDKEHTIKYKKDEKIIWNTSFSLSSLVFNTK
tara:strand:+ start:13034 stop:13711 length:678 start_codon:yes stop_codon:yes gene_type:complete